METTLTVQVCNLCESTDVHFHSKQDKFICNTCGQHMTEQQTAIKYLSKAGNVLAGFALFFLMLISLPGKSQVFFKDTILVINIPSYSISVPTLNTAILRMEKDTLQLDSGIIRYVKVKGGAASSVTKLFNPVNITPAINLLQQMLDSIRIKFSGQSLYYYSANEIPVGFGSAYKLPVDNACIVDTALLRAYNSVDSSLYYLDSRNGILKAKPGQAGAIPIGNVIFTNVDVKKK